MSRADVFAYGCGCHVNSSPHLRHTLDIQLQLQNNVCANQHVPSRELLPFVSLQPTRRRARQRCGSSLSMKEPVDQDHYRVLDVAYNATGAQLKKAYHAAAKKHHPDKVTPTRTAKSTVAFQHVRQCSTI